MLSLLVSPVIRLAFLFKLIFRSCSHESTQQPVRLSKKAPYARRLCRNHEPMLVYIHYPTSKEMWISSRSIETTDSSYCPVILCFLHSAKSMFSNVLNPSNRICECTYWMPQPPL